MSNVIDEYLGLESKDEQPEAKVKKNRETFYDLRDEELRALSDRELTNGAARLFCLLSKLVWFPQCGGRYKGQIGVIAIPQSDLKRILGADKKSITPWHRELQLGNYIWVSVHKIKNSTHGLNVYDLSCLDPPSLAVNFSSLATRSPPGGVPLRASARKIPP